MQEAVVHRSRQPIDETLRIVRAHAAVRRALSTQLEAAHGLTMTDLEALTLLSRAPEQRMRRTDLAEALLLTPSGVTRLLQGLEQAGLVERRASTTDLRVSYAVLTEAGHEKLALALRSHRVAAAALFERGD